MSSTVSEPMTVDEPLSNDADAVELKSCMKFCAPAKDKSVFTVKRRDPHNKSVLPWNVTLLQTDFRLIDSGVTLSAVSDKVVQTAIKVDDLEGKLLNVSHSLSENDSCVSTLLRKTEEFADTFLAENVANTAKINLIKENLNQVEGSVKVLAQDVNDNCARIINMGTKIVKAEEIKEQKEHLNRVEASVQVLAQDVNDKMDNVKSCTEKLSHDIWDVAGTVVKMEEEVKKALSELRCEQKRKSDALAAMTNRLNDMEEAYSQRLEQMENRLNSMETRFTSEEKLQHYVSKEEADVLRVKCDELAVGIEDVKTSLNCGQDDKKFIEEEVDALKDAMGSITNVEDFVQRYVSREINKNGENLTKAVSEQFFMIKDVESTCGRMSEEMKALRENYNADMLRSERSNRDAMDSVAADIVARINEIKSDVLKNHVEVDSIKQGMEVLAREISETKSLVVHNVIVCDEGDI